MKTLKVPPANIFFLLFIFPVTDMHSMMKACLTGS